MRLQLATWPEVETYLVRSTSIILPTGSTEQHGPTGLIGTDSLCAESIAWRVGELLDVMVAPTLAIGMAQHHMSFPGSMTLRPSTLLAVVRDCLLSLVRHGFTRVLVLNGHGGNCPTLQAAFAETQMELDIQRPRPLLRTRMINWWELPQVDLISAELFGNSIGSHATPSEVAVTWALHPDCADPRPLVPRCAPRAAVHGADDFRANFPDGRIGSDPSLASPENGVQILNVAVDEISELAERFFEGE